MPTGPLRGWGTRLLLLSLSSACGGSAHLQPVSVTQPSPTCHDSRTATVCTYLIDSFPVRARVTEYPSIRFLPGDSVTLSGGGCVNVGGIIRANRWHPIIDDIDAGTDRLFYGTIWIPGVTIGPEPLRYLLTQGTSPNDSTLHYFVSKPIRIPPMLKDDGSATSYLRLGYADDSRGTAYADNGYSAWTATDNIVCSYVAPHRSAEASVENRVRAWLRLDVVRPRKPDIPTDTTHIRLARIAALGFSPSAPFRDSVQKMRATNSLPVANTAQPGFAAFDNIVDAIDANGMPVNPQWKLSTELAGFLGDPRPSSSLCAGFQYKLERLIRGIHTHGVDIAGMPNGCMSVSARRRLTIDEPGYLKNIPCGSTGTTGQFHGHINWFAATFRGPQTQVLFSDYSADGDVDMDLATEAYAGQTAENASSRLHLEFNHAETVDRFRLSPWWSEFADHSKAWKLVNRNLPDTNRNRLPPHGGLLTIATGLFGLDAIHGAHAEVHPVFAIAMQTQNDDVTGEEWEVFVRNYGNEGECSQEEHFLDLPDGVFHLEIPDASASPAWTISECLYLTAPEFTAKGDVPRNAEERRVHAVRTRVEHGGTVIDIPLPNVVQDPTGVTGRTAIYGSVRILKRPASQQAIRCSDG